MSGNVPKEALVEAEASIRDCFASLTAANSQESVAVLTQSLERLRELQQYFAAVQDEPATATSVEDDITELRKDIAAKEELLQSNSATMREWAQVFDGLAQTNTDVPDPAHE